MNQVRRRVRLEDTRWNAQHVILFCPITSRVGSDVEAALGKVPYGQRVILVLMHHTRDASYSTAGRKWSETTENVDLDVHILFHESVQGLITCAQNNEAVLQIQTFLAQNKSNSVLHLTWDLLRYCYWTLLCIFSWVWNSGWPWMRLWNWLGKLISPLVPDLVLYIRKPKVTKDSFA
ncbi:hypothetical protein CHARACLAT_028733 [Characodon lateralis]|uniref:Uncharacterized protein n=1 Tax=Characodon lateralis TaxID=208331 RepID=A0ABU7DAX0_9TELE|nr:hypothetical protein [Characodon lateralis]